MKINKKLRKIIIVYAAATAVCVMIYYIADTVLNGAFLDWFDKNFMLTYYRYSEIDGDSIIREPIWYKIKILILIFFLIFIYITAAAVIISSKISAKKTEKEVITKLSGMFHDYMKSDAEISNIFPKEYAEISSQIIEIKAALKQEASRRNDLIAYLAHDLKTPLTSIIGYLSLLSEAADMPEENRVKYVGITLEKAYRLEKMINEFFEIARYNLQQITVNKENIDLYYMLVQLADELTPILSPRGNTAVLKCDENMTVYADPDKLARVFNNVMKNAAAYSFPNTEIIISAHKSDGNVIIIFENRGKTIPREKLSSIFEKFYRLDEARASNTGGAGLGLAIAKEIITLHGGTISADSRDNTVVFTIKLPDGN